MDRSESDSESDFFMTQSKFSQVIESDYDTDDVVADLLDLQKPKKVNLTELTYQPVVSDISDEELLAASIAVKKKEEATAVITSDAGVKAGHINTDRFETPKGDKEMAKMTTRRYIVCVVYLVICFTFFF